MEQSEHKLYGRIYPEEQSGEGSYETAAINCHFNTGVHLFWHGAFGGFRGQEAKDYLIDACHYRDSIRFES